MMSRALHWTFLNSLILISLEEEIQPRIDLPVGSIMGKRDVTADGTTFYSYLGIPYGEAPVGSMRFQAPVERTPWSVVLNATVEGNRCYQWRKDNSKANEDCLILNVFTPVEPCTSASLPVLFWIHGGGFLRGFSSLKFFGGDHFIDKDVILVTINYRLGSFGFLSFGDLVLPGNAGLKDQYLALKWVNKYIKYFGGDADKITIFGQSAGSASIAYHLLSGKSAGLFRAAILESGTSLTPWAFQRRLTEVSHKLARKINETRYNELKDSSLKLLNYLQSLPADIIQNATNTDFSDMTPPRYNGFLDGNYFTPTIEQKHEGAFITQKMFEQLNSGNFEKVPIILGFTTLELCQIQNDPEFNDTVNAFDNDITMVVPKDMNVEPDHKLAAATKIYNFYTHGMNFKSNYTNYLEYFSDQGLSRSVRKYAEIASKYTDVYLYQFAYKGILNGASKPVIGFSEDVCHMDELAYLFSGIYKNINTKNWSNLNAMDRTVAERMTTLWTNFAKCRHPTPRKMHILQNLIWPEFGSESKFLDIGSFLEIKERPKEDMYRMWEDTSAEWGCRPFDTY